MKSNLSYHGGARKGSGRPPGAQNKKPVEATKTVTFKFKLSTIEALKARAALEGLSQNKLLEKLIKSQ